MRRLPVVILVMVALLVAVVTGCGAHRYDGRLVAADSLIAQGCSDSALALLEALPTAALTTDGDRAYHGLLISQARYKAYVVATSDSDINRALSYYRAHSREREKLTRAYIYKGAVMEELGHPDSAMYYYKSAEATADEKDYVNLGQINTRIANLYRIYYGNEHICYKRYNHAYKYHVLTGNKVLQFYNLYNMFMMNAITHQEHNDSILEKVKALAVELDDSSKMFGINELHCRQLLQYDSTLQMSKGIAMNCLNEFGQYINNDLLLDLAFIYIKEGELDSARFYINHVNETLNPDDQERIIVRKLEISSMISTSEGNYSNAGDYLKMAKNKSDSILNSTYKYRIEKIDKIFDEQAENRKSLKISSLKGAIGLFICLIVALLAILLIVLHYNRVKRTKLILEGLKGSAVNDHAHLLSQLDSKSDVIENMISNLVELIRSCLEAGADRRASHVARQIKDSVVNVADESFWKALKSHVDKHHNGIISTIAQYPGIKESDLRFIELCCCNFSYIEIAIIMGYSPKYISTKRRNIVKKLEKDHRCQEYINRIMTKE